MQEGAPIEIPRARAMVPRLNRLLDVCRAHQIPVIYIHHVIRGGAIDAGRLADHHEAIRNNQAILAGTPNVEIYEGLTPQPGDLKEDIWLHHLGRISLTRGVSPI